MKKRAIVLVHGYEKVEQNTFTHRLKDGLTYYTDGIDKDFEPDPVDHDGILVERLTAQARTAGAPKIQIDLYEAYWADMIPTEIPGSIWQRVGRGGMLLAYWFLGGLARRIIGLRGFLPTTLGISLALSGVLLMLWYLSLLMLAAKAVVADPNNLPVWLQNALTAAPTDAKTSIQDFAVSMVKSVEQTPWWAIVSGMLAGLPADKVASVAEFAKAYLTDERVGEVPAGLRARTKRRLVTLLEQIYASKDPYDEIFVIGHSLGSAIALDALADYGDDRARTYFLTWGSPLRVLCAQEPQIEQERKKMLAATPPLANWTDCIAMSDFIGACVPGHQDAWGAENVIWVTLPRGFLGGFNISSHGDYYRTEQTLKMLLEPAKTRQPLQPETPTP